MHDVFICNIALLVTLNAQDFKAAASALFTKTYATVVPPYPASEAAIVTQMTQQVAGVQGLAT